MENLQKIDEFLTEKDINPIRENIFKVFENDLSNIKVVIIGQDPYPARGVATGRSFEVGGLKDWNSFFRQVSIKNILRNICASCTDAPQCLSFTDVKTRINDGRFPILPPDTLFESWERQGVMLLNGGLTCAVGVSGSHMDIWKEFSEATVKYIAENNKSAIFFLWGAYAKGFASLIGDNKRIYKSNHPMMCANSIEDLKPWDFLSNPCFIKTKNVINWLGVDNCG